MASPTTSSPPAAAAASVRSVLVITLSPPGACRARLVLRIRPSPAWAPKEDAALARLANEHGFRHWRRVADRMPGRSYRQCRDRWCHHLARDVYHRPFTARDDDELLRLFVRHGGRWKAVARAAHHRTSRVMRRRWKAIRDTSAVLSKLWRPLPPSKPDANSEDSYTSLSSQQQSAGVVFGSGLPPFSLGRDDATVSLPASVTAL